MNRRRGFSLIEVMLAVAVLAVALLGVAAAAHYGTSSGLSSGIRSEASLFARAILEELSTNASTVFPAGSGGALPAANSGLNDTMTWPVAFPWPTGAAQTVPNTNSAPRPLNDYPFTSLPGDTRFRRMMQVQEYRQPSETSAEFAWKGDLRQVTLWILWAERGRPQRLQYAVLVRRPL